MIPNYKKFAQRFLRKIISYALFGDRWDFAACLPAVVRAHHVIFPASDGWTMRIHHDDRLYSRPYGDVLQGLAARGLVELRYMGAAPLCRAMLWRMAPVFEQGVDIVFCRDLDSLPTPRDRLCCDDFMGSDAVVHTIHDNSLHVGIMGGLCGFKAAPLREAYKSLDAFCALSGSLDWGKKGADQILLNAELVPRFPTYVHSDRVDPTAAFYAPVPSAHTEADHLIAHLGAAGFYADKAVAFYATGGQAENIRDAEVESCYQRPLGARVVLSSDMSPDYSFYIPLTCALWIQKGYLPTLLLAGTADAWLASAPCRLALETARQIGAEVHFLGDFLGGFRTSTVAQVARLFGAFVPGVADDDYLLTSDMDMWPIGDWVGGADAKGLPVQLYYANAYNGETDYPAPAHYPICYIGMRAKTWCEVLKTGGVGLRGSLAWTLADCVESVPDGTPRVGWEWSFDEVHFGQRIAAWTGYPDQCQMIWRDMSVVGQRRLDRSRWRVPETLTEFADAHLPRPGFAEHWPSIRLLFSLKMPDRLAWADAYRAAYLEAKT